MNYLSKSKNLFNCITTTAVERDKTYHDNTQLVFNDKSYGNSLTIAKTTFSLSNYVVTSLLVPLQL